MTSNDLIITPARPEEAPRIATIMRAAFGPGKYYSRMYRGANFEQVDEIFAERIVKNIADPEYEVVTVKRRGNDEPIAFALWSKPRPWRESTEKPKRRIPDGIDPNLLIRAFDLLDKVVQNIKEPMYHLSIIAVSPEGQGMGIGKHLLLHLQSLAEHDGVPIYLEALEEGVPVYNKLGYKAYAEDEVLEKDCWYRPMVWRPASQAQNGSSTHKLQSQE